MQCSPISPTKVFCLPKITYDIRRFLPMGQCRRQFKLYEVLVLLVGGVF